MVTATRGLPTVMEGIRRWQRGWIEIAGEVRPAAEYFVDGPGIHPKDPHLRRVSWGVAWWNNGEIQRTGGTVLGSQTVA